MKYLVALSLLVSAPAFATGGFDCADQAGKTSISAAVSHGLGSLIGDVTVTRDGVERRFKRAEVIQYKNRGDELFALIVDYDPTAPGAEELIELDVRGEKGTVEFSGGKSEAKVNVECLFE